jgi:MmyB-like transcription regulator ligand binding domain
MAIQRIDNVGVVVDDLEAATAHNVRTHGTGIKHFHHHIVGDLTLAYESLDLRAEPGLTMTIYAAEPDSPTAHALALLASWAATQQLSPVEAQTEPP